MDKWKNITNIFEETPDLIDPDTGEVLVDPDTGETLKEAISKAIDDQGTSLSADIVNSKASIAETEQEIKTIDENIKTLQEEIDRYNAEEKVANADIEVTHSTKGGPANPSSIKPASSTIGRRNGGPGSGLGPRGHGGPGGPGRPGM